MPHQTNAKARRTDRRAGPRDEVAQRGTDPRETGKSARQDAVSPVDRTRLRVHEDALACLVAADAVAKVASEPLLEQVRTILQEATARIDELAASGDAGAIMVTLPQRRLHEYFPREDESEPSARELAEARADWDAGSVQQLRFRQEALTQVGPLLAPRDVTERLGVSRATVANWRAHGKLLGVRFDAHEYLYPVWQFANSPSEGERGVVWDLEKVLAALDDAHPWDKAKFLLTPLPALSNRRSIDVLRCGLLDERRLVVQLANQRGELGT